MSEIEFEMTDEETGGICGYMIEDAYYTELRDVDLNELQQNNVFEYACDGGDYNSAMYKVILHSDPSDFSSDAMAIGYLEILEGDERTEPVIYDECIDMIAQGLEDCGIY